MHMLIGYLESNVMLLHGKEIILNDRTKLNVNRQS